MENNLLENKVKEWSKIKALIEEVRIRRGREQREWLDKYIEARNAYELKYHERYNMLQRPIY